MMLCKMRPKTVSESSLIVPHLVKVKHRPKSGPKKDPIHFTMNCCWPTIYAKECVAEAGVPGPLYTVKTTVKPKCCKTTVKTTVETTVKTTVETTVQTAVVGQPQ